MEKIYNFIEFLYPTTSCFTAPIPSKGGGEMLLFKVSNILKRGI